MADVPHFARPKVSASDAQRYLLRTGLLGLALAASIAVVSYFADPGEQFRRPTSVAALGALTSGRAISYDKNLDLRFLNRKLIETEQPPDVILLGSSVTANIGGPILKPPVSFRNLSVNGGTLVDQMALLGAYLKTGKWPRRVILWVDGISFDVSRTDPRWAANTDSFSLWAKSIGVEPNLAASQSSVDTLRQVLSWSYFRLSIESMLRRGWRGSPATYPPTSDPASARFMYPDGSRSWGKAVAGPAAGVRSKALKVINTGLMSKLYAAFDVTALTPQRNVNLKLLDATLEELHRRNIEAVLYVTPFCPCVLPEVEALGVADKLRALDAELKLISERHGTQFVGSSVPSAQNPTCGEDDYYDYHHLADACHRRYLSDILR